MKQFLWVFGAELRLRYRQRGSLLFPLAFFVLLCSLFPLSLPATSSSLLPQIAPAVIWIMLLISCTMGAESLFRQDYEVGILEQVCVSGHSMTIWVLAKILAFWCAGGLLIALLSPLLGLMLGMQLQTLPRLCIALIIGSLTVSMLGALGAALTLRLARSGLVLLLVLLPLYVPVLIFGSALTVSDMTQEQVWASLYLLIAVSVLVLTLSPVTVGYILKGSVS